MEFFTFLVAFVVVGVFTCYFLSRQNIKIVSKHDGNRKLVHFNDYPIVGMSLRFWGTSEHMYTEMMRIGNTHRDQGMVILQMGLDQVLMIYKDEYMQKVLSSGKHLDKSLFYDMLQPWLGVNVFTSTSEIWATRRKLLTPSFHYNILNDFVIVFNEQALIMCDKLEERIGQGEFDIGPYITLCALDIICATAMGKNLNAQKDSDSEYVKALHNTCEILVERQFSPWLWPDLLFNLIGNGRKFAKCTKVLHDFTKNIIELRQKEYNENEAKIIEEENAKMDAAEETNIYIKKKRRVFLDLLLYHWHRGDLTTKDIQAEVDTFMFAGHDTTSVATMWALYMIVSHPEVYEKVNQEIDFIFGDSDRPATPDDLKKLDYLEMAMKESQRIYPSVPFIGRMTSEELEIDGYIIPPKHILTLFIGCLHRDPDNFPDPLVYDPDRFLPENTRDRHPFAFIPFSAGRRNCIGQKFAIAEEKTLLSWIFRRFRVETTQTEADLHPDISLVLRPKYGIKVKVSKR